MFCSNGYLLDVCFGLCVEMRKKKWKSIGSMKSMIGNEWMGLCLWLNVRFFFSLNSVHRLVQCRAIPIRYELFFFHHFYFDWTNIIIYSIWMDSELRWARDTRCLYVVVASENMCQFMLESVDWNQLIIYCCCCCWNVVKVAMK